MICKKRLIHKTPFLFLPKLLALCTAATVLFGGCQEQIESDGKLNIVATTTILADLSNIIGGEYVHVNSLMGPGIDPHLYQPSAGDVTKMQHADVIIYHGLHLEGKMGDIFSSLSEQGYSNICIEYGLDASMLLSSEKSSSLYDPHIWFDVAIWKSAAIHTAMELSVINPENADAYAANLEEYLLELDSLDRYIQMRIAEVPENQRILVTAHDAFRYFGAAYGFKVMALQGISTETEAGTADVSRLADFIAENEIKAIFAESSVPAKSMEALQAAVQSRGFEVKIGSALYADALGDDLSGHNTLILVIKSNIDTIVDALK